MGGKGDCKTKTGNGLILAYNNSSKSPKHSAGRPKFKNVEKPFVGICSKSKSFEIMS